jgi:hypothetical protein
MLYVFSIRLLRARNQRTAQRPLGHRPLVLGTRIDNRESALVTPLDGSAGVVVASEREARRKQSFCETGKTHRARGCVSAIDSVGRTIWIADAHRDDGKRFVVHADEKLSAFVGLEREALTVTFYLTSIHAGDF